MYKHEMQLETRERLNGYTPAERVERAMQAESMLHAERAELGLPIFDFEDGRTEDAELMATLMRWSRSGQRCAYEFERAFAGLHAAEIVGN